MATLQSFYPWVQLDCPNVPSAVLDDAIRRGIREFCKETLAIEHQDVFDSVVGQTDYTIPLEANTEMITVLTIKRGTSDLTASSKEYIAKLTGSGPEATLFATLETNPITVRLHPTPTTVTEYTSNVAVMPTSTTTTVDDRLFQWYLEAVVAYAKYWLMIQPNKDWTNAEQAAFEWNRYLSQCFDVKSRRSQGRAGLVTTVQMKPFA